MTKKYSTKRALIASVLALCMCFTMLIGTTFAWFTDSVTSGGNIIQTGTLDVEMYWAEGDKEVPTDNNGWTNAASGTMFNYTKWEPGYAEAKHIKISNVGTLALKYQLRIVSSSELTELADVIDVYYYDEAKQLTRDSLAEADRLGTLAEVIDASRSNALFKTVRGNLESGKDTTLTLVLKMRESAGNEYQGLYLNGGFSIQLLATQYTSEDDSFGDDYDVDAQYPVITTPAYILPTDKNYTAFSFNTTDVKVTGSAALAADLANSGVTKVTFKASDVVIKDGVATIATVAFYNQDGKEINLAGYNEPITVRIYVGDAYKGENVVVSHNDDVVATETVDNEGYVSYTATHFCKVTVELGKKISEGSVIIGGEVVEDLDEIEEEDLTTIVDMVIGNHTYKVSLGMAKSWKEYENVPGKIEADIYLPEDLYAFSMMYKNGDLAETGSHSDLTLMNDLDFKGKNWEPIGRFYTNIHGAGKKISNLSDSLLGCVYDCQVENLTLENVTASGSAAGVIAKELAGDIFLTNVTIAGENKVTYKADGKTNWPESGYGIGAISGVSLIGCAGLSDVNVTINGTIELNYGENAIFYNASRCQNLGITKEFGLNVYKTNTGVNVTGSENITVVKGSNCYMLLTDEATDGKYDIVDGVAVSPDGKTYALLNLAGLKWFADYVNAGNNMKDYTVNLLSDIDLEDEEWTPIGYMGKTFMGTFDGNNHTIKNLKITKALENSAENNGIGFFGRTDDPAVIKNFTIENADVSGSLYVGAVAGLAYTGKAIENVTVKGNIFIDAWWYAGVIGGDGYMKTIKNCSVIANSGSYVKGNGGSYIGAIWGFHGEGTCTFTDCVAENINISGNDRVGAISGISHYGNIIENCTARNVTITANKDGVTTVGLVAGACQGKESSPSIFKNNKLENVHAYVANGEGAYVEVYNIYGTDIDGKDPVTNVVAVIGTTTYESIAAAIEAAKDGDTVRLTAGTRHEALNLQGKSLTIQGAGKDKTFIAGPEDYTTSNIPMQSWAGWGQDANVYALISANKDVTIKDLTVNGDPKQIGEVGEFRYEGAYAFVGIHIQSANAVIENVDIKGIKPDTVTGNDHHNFGLYITSAIGDNDTYEVTYKNGTVSDVNRGGIYCWGNKYTLHFEAVTVIGPGNIDNPNGTLTPAANSDKYIYAFAPFYVESTTTYKDVVVKDSYRVSWGGANWNGWANNNWATNPPTGVTCENCGIAD